MLLRHVIPRRPRVAPREGAWIEMLIRTPKPSTFSVAPREGAWIEISMRETVNGSPSSRPVRARGLK